VLGRITLETPQSRATMQTKGTKSQ
jgi:hypothetical protein